MLLVTPRVVQGLVWVRFMPNLELTQWNQVAENLTHQRPKRGLDWIESNWFLGEADRVLVEIASSRSW